MMNTFNAFFSLVSIIILGRLCRGTMMESIPIGLISEPDDNLPSYALKNALWLAGVSETSSGFMSSSTSYTYHLLEENVPTNDTVEIDRAVCRLMKQGIQVLVAATNAVNYFQLRDFAVQFQLPLLSPSFPEVLPNGDVFGVGIEPSTTRALLLMLQHFKMNHFIYLYDSDEGPHRLQTMLHSGYRSLKIELAGIMRVTSAVQANLYLRKLQSLRKQSVFPVVLDMDLNLVKSIITHHVNDIHVGKLNFHFLVARPAASDFWTKSAEFGAVNVTGFQVITSSLERSYKESFMTKWQRSVTIQKSYEFSTTAYLYHDVGLVLASGMKELYATKQREFSVHLRNGTFSWRNLSRNCMDDPPVAIADGKFLLERILRKSVNGGLSGNLRFDRNGNRKDFELEVIQSNKNGKVMLGTVTPQGRLKVLRERPQMKTSAESQIALPSNGNEKLYTIATVISPPFMMRRQDEDGVPVVGNDRYEGYCKDLLELLTGELDDFRYMLKETPDGQYGRYNIKSNDWTGAVGEIVRGKADLVVADLHLTPNRMKVVDFVEPYTTVSLSILLKSPRASTFPSSPFFFLSAFSVGTWICLIASALIVVALFHLFTEFTGTPDNIEDASGIWGKKFTVLSSAWFTVGSALMQDTGVYPRSGSSRLLGASWWCFSSVLLAFYIASLTAKLAAVNSDQSPQVNKLSSLSFQSVLAESVTNNWPRIGVLKGSYMSKYVQESTIPVFANFGDYLRRHPDLLINSTEEAVDLVRSSQGSFGFLMESLASDYYSKLLPCDAISVHDSVASTAYAIAVSQKHTQLTSDLNKALNTIRRRGDLGELHRKWFVNANQCKTGLYLNDDPNGKLRTFAGVFYALLIGLGITILVGAIQYFWNNDVEDNRRRQLSFEEVAIAQDFSMSPQQNLGDSPPIEEDRGIIDGWEERKLVPITSFGHGSSARGQAEGSVS